MTPVQADSATARKRDLHHSAFSITLPDAAAYEVSVLTQPDDPLQQWTVANGTGTIVDDDIAEVQVECTDRPDAIFNDRFGN